MNRWAAAGAGGVALPLAVGMMHPLDTVRTTMQATQTRGFSDALRSLGSRGIARGFGLSFLWASPQGAIRMASYETCKDQLLDKFYAKSFGIAVSAVLADFASSVIKVPRELITQRMQTGQYLSSWTAFQSILRQDGIGGLFRGYLSTASRDTPFMVLLFFSYEQFKAWKIRLTFADRDPSLLLAPMKPWSDAETETWIQTYLVSLRFGFFSVFSYSQKPRPMSYMQVMGRDHSFNPRILSEFPHFLLCKACAATKVLPKFCDRSDKNASISTRCT